MLRYWQTLLDNLVFLICLMPLVGAVLVAFSARLGAEAIRRTALTNALLTFSLVALMVAQFDSHADESATDPVQMSTSWPWLQTEEFRHEQRTGSDGQPHDVLVAHRRGPNVRIAFGVDGINLWMMALSAVLMIPAMLAVPRHNEKAPALYYGSLLLLQSALLGLFAALDVVFFLICLELTAIPLLVLIGRFGGYERLRVARRFFIVHLAGTLLVSCGLLAVVATHARMRIEPSNPRAAPSFDTRQLIFGGITEGVGHPVKGLRELVLQNEASLDYWDEASPWIFLALFAGFTLHAAVVPWHLWLTRASVESPTSAALVLLGMGPALGAYGLARFVVPLFPGSHLPAVEWVATFGVLGSIYAGLIALTQRDLKQLAAYVGISQTCLGMAGIFSFNTMGMAGGIVLIASAGLSNAALMFLANSMRQPPPRDDVEPDNHWHSPRTRRCLFLAAMSIIGVPGFGSFVGQFLVLQGLLDGGLHDPGSPLTAAGGLLAVGFVTWSVLQFLRAVACEADPRLPVADDLSLEKLLAVGVCLAGTLLIGIFPACVTKPMEQSVAEAVAGRSVETTPAETDGSQLDQPDVLPAAVKEASHAPEATHRVHPHVPKVGPRA